MGIDKWSPFKKTGYWPVGMMIPALTKVNTMLHRGKSESESLVCTIALLRYKKETGAYPESLAELVADGYLKDLPMDPYSGGTLVYKKHGQDFILYSLGADFDDNGAEQTPKYPWGQKEGGDRVFWPIQASG